MDENTLFYMTPNAMEPLFPDEIILELEELSIQLIEKASNLSNSLPPSTVRSIADMLRPMNSYYSNLIEGHDTHPIDIARALRNDYSEDLVKRDLQIEARAHIQLHEEITHLIKSSEFTDVPTSTDFIQFLHKKFYELLPESFKKIRSKEGLIKYVIPGELRNSEVEVGRHIAPFSEKLPLFMDRFEEFYNPTLIYNKSKIRRIISIACSHHRLVWIHPFLDGNGRVVRLFSDAFFIYENLDANGLWSISRGLARNNKEYKVRLANADLKRYNDYDGRGNLSNKMLNEFCSFFISIALDQIDYMSKILDLNSMLLRINKFVDMMVIRDEMRTESRYILTELFVKGELNKTDAMRITNFSDKTLKLLIDNLIRLELLKTRKVGKNVMYYPNYPIIFSPMLFPGLYPSDKEMEMMTSNW